MDDLSLFRSPQKKQRLATLDFDLDFDPSSAAVLGSLAEDISKLSLAEGSASAYRGDDQQERSVSLAASGRNLFITGRAGTGKSWTTRRIVASLLDQKKSVHVTAPTGMAAINVDGTTIHRWGGFGLGGYYSDYDKMLSPESSKRIRETDALILDELSMMSAHMFDVLECAVAIVRHYTVTKDRLKALPGGVIGLEEGGRGQEGSLVSLQVLKMRWVAPENGGLADIPPWGGMQIVLVGDFFQLPPIPNGGRHDTDGGVLLENNELAEEEYNLKVGRQGLYAFQSHAWSRSNLQTVELTKVHRQVDDDGLLDLLNAMREGRPMSDHGAAINSIRAPLPPREDGIVPTALYAKNIDAQRKNEMEMNKLPGKSHDFSSRDEVVLGMAYKRRLLEKHGLQTIGHMPYLWAGVEEEPDSEKLREAKREMEGKEEKKDVLIAEQAWGELPAVCDEIAALKKSIEDMEREELEKATITAESIAAFLQPSGNEGDAAAVYEQICTFQDQLKKDHKTLTKHANDVFFEKGCRVGEEIELKEHAQVMLLWNLDLGKKLVNGSRGVVLGFVPAREYQQLLRAEHSTRTTERKEKEEKEEKEKDDAVVADANSITQQVKGEIALLSTDDIQAELLDVDSAAMRVKEFPFVKFDCAARLLLPRPFRKEFKGCGSATRWQLPVAQAWAISIHKSQGMTIDWLRVDLNGCFSAGQAYVAVSRGTSARSMEVENFRASEIKTSEIVQKFYAAMGGGETYEPPVWRDTLQNFEQTERAKAGLKEAMERTHGGKLCKKCSAVCDLRVVSKNNGNRGKWFLQCPQEYSNGHTWEYVPVVTS